MEKGKGAGRVIFLCALALVFSAAEARAATAECWVVCSARTGDVGFGSTSGGVTKLDGALVHRTVKRVVRVDPATGKRVIVRTFTGGVYTTRMTWARFVAAERRR